MEIGREPKQNKGENAEKVREIEIGELKKSKIDKKECASTVFGGNLKLPENHDGFKNRRGIYRYHDGFL